MFTSCRSSLSALSLLLASLALVACEPTIDDAQWSCLEDRDCLEGFVCHERIGACVTPDSIAVRWALSGDPNDIRTTQAHDGVRAALAVLPDGDLPVALALDVVDADAITAVDAAVDLVGDEETVAVLAHVGAAGLQTLFDTLQSVPLVIFGTSTDEATPAPVPVTGKFVMDRGRDAMWREALTFAFADHERGAPASNTILGYNTPAPPGDFIDAFRAANDDAAPTILELDESPAFNAMNVLRTLIALPLVEAADGTRPVLLALDMDVSAAANLLPLVRDSLYAIQKDEALPSGVDLTDAEKARVRKVGAVHVWHLDGEAIDELGTALDPAHCPAVWGVTPFARADVYDTALYANYTAALTAHDPEATPSLIGLQGYLQARLLIRAMQTADDPRSRRSVLEALKLLDADLAAGWYEAADLDDGYFVDAPRANALNTLCDSAALDLSTPTAATDRCNAGVCLYQGVILEDTTFTRDVLYKIRGPLHVGDGITTPTLTIASGTRILADTTTPTRLVVHPRARLVAAGTVDAPIEFTSDKLEDQRERGDWGGITIVSDGALNGCGAQSCAETVSGAVAGGNAAAPDSGELRYTRIAYAGQDGPALNLVGVGASTLIDHVQVHRPAGIGVNASGGAASMRYVYISGYGEVGFATERGHHGRIQYLLTHQYRFAGRTGLRVQNHPDLFDALPRTATQISQATFVGDLLSPNADIGVKLSAGGAAQIHNAIVTGFPGACYDVDDDATFFALGFLSNETLTFTEESTLTDTLLPCAPVVVSAATDPFDLQDVVFNPAWSNSTDDPLLQNPFVPSSPNYRPGLESPALTGAGIIDDPFFDEAVFRGAMDDQSWIEGWSTDAP